MLIYGQFSLIELKTSRLPRIPTQNLTMFLKMYLIEKAYCDAWLQDNECKA